MVIKSHPSSGFLSPGLAADFIDATFRRCYGIASPLSDAVTSPSSAVAPAGWTSSHKQTHGAETHHLSAPFFAVPSSPAPPDWPCSPSTSAGDLNQGLLIRPCASSARSSLTVRLRRRTQKFRSCVLDIDVEVVPCCGRSGHVRHVDPPAPERHNPSGIHGTLCRRR